MFLKNYPFTKSTILIALLMVVSASFTRQLMEIATICSGKSGFKISIVFILIGTATLFFSWKLKLPHVRMHILMYALVGWLASRDAMRRGRTWKTIVWPGFLPPQQGLYWKALPWGVILYLIRPKNLDNMPGRV